jgi:hypothetical protein
MKNFVLGLDIKCNEIITKSTRALCQLKKRNKDEMKTAYDRVETTETKPAEQENKHAQD